ncbi:MAG: hypothetical protein HYS76_00335, partial [Candidatus Wildermuthbacteria bacterium]|nr:hypothetical protein [Candidatus Wildermuthbacteria bacterium]
MRVEPGQLKTFLLDAGLVAQAQMKAAEQKAKKQKQRLAEVLIAEGVISHEQLIKME